VEVAAEVAAFEGKVRGDEHFGAGGRAEDGTIVADAQGEGLASRGGEGVADLLDQGKFFHAACRINRWEEYGEKVERKV
jgi:hypothetical protein